MQLQRSSRWMTILRRSNGALLSHISHISDLQGSEASLLQMLAGPAAPLPRALAAPFSVDGFWDDTEEARAQLGAGSSPGEQLFALKAALDAVGRYEAPGAAIDTAACATLIDCCQQPQLRPAHLLSSLPGV
ncbi:hypothetical protein OEZ85_013226 [Tetradesmus obliquus]|uniref:Uncharacterized protein n=1 Tax=Tetradesmus obliquus TaxID=3088 RepID=A0ABY8U521_TETOB|nr:hypothetical protein OEZ85_013226 [Tetradesmus obliquus]